MADSVLMGGGARLRATLGAPLLELNRDFTVVTFVIQVSNGRTH